MQLSLRPALSPEEAEKFLNYRFRLTDRSHPVIVELHSFVFARITGGPVRVDEMLEPVIPDKANVDRMADSARFLSSLEPLELLRPEMQLPVLPPVLLELQSVMQKENISVEEISKIVMKDVSLSAWLLRLVNSAYYGFPGRIETVSRAVALLGFQQLHSVVSSGILRALIGSVRASYFNKELCWRHNVAVALLASELWRAAKRPDPERLFVAGQLHDVGKLALACTAPDHADLIWPLNEAAGGLLYEHEQRYLGFDHAILGGVLLRKWNMPVALVMAALRHHEQNAMEKYPEIAAVHVADVMAHAMGIASAPFNTVPPMFPEAWNACGLRPESVSSVLRVTCEYLDSLNAAMSG